MNFCKKRIFLPQKEDKNVDPFKFEDSHMTTEQSYFFKQIIADNKLAISTPSDPLGCFKLFQASINFFPGKTSIQHKRQINFDQIFPDIQRMLK